MLGKGSRSHGDMQPQGQKKHNGKVRNNGCKQKRIIDSFSNTMESFAVLFTIEIYIKLVNKDNI